MRLIRTHAASILQPLGSGKRMGKGYYFLIKIVAPNSVNLFIIKFNSQLTYFLKMELLNLKLR
jgi:hypothetical protein